MHFIVQNFEEDLPKSFFAIDLDDLTNKIIRWKTIRNIRTPKYKGDKLPPPATCFSRVSNKVVVNRDPFLEWWGSQFLSD